MLSGAVDAWWSSIRDARQAGSPPFTWTEFVTIFMDEFMPLSDRDECRR